MKISSTLRLRPIQPAPALELPVVTTSERPASAAADPTVAEPRSWSSGELLTSLSGTIREQTEKVSHLVAEQADRIGDLVAGQAAKAEQSPTSRPTGPG
jgi:hypothetical protein